MILNIVWISMAILWALWGVGLLPICIVSRLPRFVRVAYCNWYTSDARNALWRAAKFSTEDLHRISHIVAAVDAISTECTPDECSINGIPARAADRITNVMVPDAPPKEWDRG